MCVSEHESILPSSKDTSFSREGTAEAIGQRGDGLRSSFLDAPETHQPEQRHKTLQSQSTRQTNQRTAHGNYPQQIPTEGEGE